MFSSDSRPPVTLTLLVSSSPPQGQNPQSATVLPRSIRVTGVDIEFRRRFATERVCQTPCRMTRVRGPFKQSRQLAAVLGLVLVEVAILILNGVDWLAL